MEIILLSIFTKSEWEMFRKLFIGFLVLLFIYYPIFNSIKKKKRRR